MTRPKSSVELNPGEVLGKIFDRFRISQGWNLKNDGTDELRIVTFIEILGTAHIPVKHWERLYQKAMVTRGRHRAAGKENSFFITPEDLVAEYDNLLRELAEKETEEKPCSQPHDDEEDRLVEYLVWGKEAVLLPCPKCRPEAHHKRKAERIDRKKENRLRLVGKS